MASSSSLSSSGINVDWNKSISSILESSEVKQIKKLRKLVLLSLQLDESDKSVKKLFKRAIQNMEEGGKVQLEADGTISLSKSKKKEKRKAKDNHEASGIDDDKDDGNKIENYDDGEFPAKQVGTEIEGEDSATTYRSEIISSSSSEKNKPCKGNPQGVTRLFLGNLPFSVDESSLGAFLPGEVTHIKWITDKETGKFYGSAFIEMDNSTSAADAVAMGGQKAMAGSKLIGRPTKINFAPAREGDVWPPPKKVISGGGTVGGGGQAGGTGTKAMSAKPDNCLKLFIGNLSYDIDDEGIIKFFGNVGETVEVKAVRWLHHKDSGDFKGCGFVEFWNTEACEKGATLNGKNLLGRPIRIDWSD
eukprot:CAMPEP_0171028428 /NCGR_PEP_ID=MMETSP0736-20130129/35727_1 /TAXON_ID=186038 /ORGANISM="Fragilariopsis kerguelensis, Strain L26-C5" /LENGTH=360 /DNA_ID=CAMNT_0011469863 /DNA_START=44 /DNA_END=1128 /DNA_ORIENTATION=-